MNDNGKKHLFSIAVYIHWATDKLKNVKRSQVTYLKSQNVAPFIFMDPV